MDHFDIDGSPDGTLTITDGVGHFIGHAAPDGLGATITNANGEIVGYDHPFGGVDYYLDSHLHHLDSLDSLGTFHSSTGEAIGHVALLDGNIEITDMHNQLIGEVNGRFGS